MRGQPHAQLTSEILTRPVILARHWSMPLGNKVLLASMSRKKNFCWEGLEPPESSPDSSGDPAMSPEAKLLLNSSPSPRGSLLPRSASLTLSPAVVIEPPSSCIQPQVIQANMGPRSSDVPVQRSSEDSGLGTNGSPRGKRPMALVLDIEQRPLSRTSSLADSMASLPATPTSLRRGGLTFPKSTGQAERDALAVMLSAVYAKLLVVMGICFPLAEVISNRIPISYYEGFYLYMYLTSILFLFYVYAFLLRQDVQYTRVTALTTMLHTCCRKFRSTPRCNSSASASMQRGVSKRKVDHAAQCGSFYLRLGAVAFGIGSMIYSGLEFGQFFELESDSHCYNILFGLTPSSRMAFTFIQLYFIFLNSRMAIYKYRTLARFGLMHMIATNLCVWLHVVVQETKHEILTLTHRNVTTLIPEFVLNAQDAMKAENALEDHHRTEEFHHSTSVDHHRMERSVDSSIYHSHECRRSNIMGELVQNASPFLFPCTIEYSLICAAILYVMWKNIGQSNGNVPDNASIHSSVNGKHTRHYYQVDCAKANKGLFTGILVLVLSIICLILFFVLINKPQYKYLAVLEAHIAELGLYLLTSLAVIIALFQVRELKFNTHRNVELDNILLIVAQSGLYLFTMFSIIGGHFTMDKNTVLVLLTSLACLAQGTAQTIFILDASRRCARNGDQMRRKPGREMVTFLLVCNFAMWAINTLERRRADANPVQMNFYGFWAWTIISHVTTPLTIFFRFHSTVCLCDIWKRTYKVKSEYV